MATLSIGAPVRLRRYLPVINDPNFVWVGVALAVALLVLNPLGWLFYTSLRAEQGGLTVEHYLDVSTTGRFLTPIINSLKLASAAAMLSLVAAAPVAWAVVRTDLPFRRLIRLLIVANLAMPPFLGAFAWQLLAGPNAGALNRFITTLTGAPSGPFNIYTMQGLIFVYTLYHYPIIFLLLSSALESIGSDLEDAANIHGAGTIRTALTVVLPLLAPAILGGLLLAFLDALSDFGTPLIIGTPANIRVITTEIYELLQGYPARTEAAAALALLLLLFTVALLLLQKRILGRRGFTTLTGRAGSQRTIRLGVWKYALLAYAVLQVLCTLVLPYLVLVSTSLSKAWGVGFGPGNLTLEHYAYLLVDNRPAQAAVHNSFLLASLAATAAVLLAAAAAFIAERRLVYGHRLVAFVASAPLVIPGIVLAIGMFLAYTKPPLFLYGTLWVLGIAYITKGMPVAFTNARAAIKAVHPELEEAARLFGASSLRTFRDISLPLMKAGLASGWMAVFVFSMRELSSAIFLYTAGTIVIAVVILQLRSEALIEATAAMGVLLLLVTILVGAISYRLLGRGVLDARS